MNDNEILATGTLCAALLVSSDFKTVIGWYEQSIAAAFLSTGSGDTAKREELYANLWGARDLLTFIETTAAAAKAITEPKPPSTTEPIDVDYDDEGFERADYEQNN